MAGEFREYYTSRLRGSYSKGGAFGGAARQGVLFASANSAGIEVYARNKLGQYTKQQGDVVEINRLLARELQELAVQSLRSQIERPGTSSKRLERAIMDPRNAYFNNSGFGVGRPSFLDFSEAKYWRAIEQGTTYFVGREIRGVWGSPLGGGTGTGKYGPYPIPQGPYSAFGESTGQKLFPMGKASALRLLRSQGGGSTKLRGTKGIIREPITPKRYFRDAWREFNVERRAQRIINRIYPAAERRAPRGKR